MKSIQPSVFLVISDSKQLYLKTLLSIGLNNVREPNKRYIFKNKDENRYEFKESINHLSINGVVLNLIALTEILNIL